MKPPNPESKCDECRSRPAVCWFGDTSVALCDSGDCHKASQARWDAMIDEDAEK